MLALIKHCEKSTIYVIALKITLCGVLLMHWIVSVNLEKDIKGNCVIEFEYMIVPNLFLCEVLCRVGLMCQANLTLQDSCRAGPLRQVQPDCKHNEARSIDSWGGGV